MCSLASLTWTITKYKPAITNLKQQTMEISLKSGAEINPNYIHTGKNVGFLFGLMINDV